MGFWQLSRRNFIKSIALAGGMILQAPLYGYRHSAFGSPCPQLSGGKILWVIPYSPGGGYDAYSRLVAPFLADRLGVSVHVENLTGAGGVRGAKKISGAVPDGRTLGIIDCAGLLSATLAGAANTPNPLEAFRLLGRLSHPRHVWVTGAGSKLKTMADVFDTSMRRPVLFGATEVYATTFANISIGSSLLNINSEYILGYKGSRGLSMATIRGDLDIVAIGFESVLDRIEAGDLRPLLQVSADEIYSHPALAGVPLLGGMGGLSAQVAARAGSDTEEAVADTEALIDLVRAGRVVAGPAGLDADLGRCLEDKLYDAMTDSAFQMAADKAKRTLDIARGSTAREGISGVMKKADRLTAILRSAVEKVRG